jgi:hypothetical protein
MDRAITLRLPDQLYQRLSEAADASQQSLDQIVLQSIRVGLPPSLDRVPQRFQADLRAMDQLSDEMLWQIARSDLDDDKATLYETLLEKNRRAKLDRGEQARLDTLREETDLLVLRRSYAYALLKWRGHRIPLLGELQAP